MKGYYCPLGRIGVALFYNCLQKDTYYCSQKRIFVRNCVRKLLVKLEHTRITFKPVARTPQSCNCVINHKTELFVSGNVTMIPLLFPPSLIGTTCASIMKGCPGLFPITHTYDELVTIATRFSFSKGRFPFG